ncbi:hypothetical protein [Runella rosea]|uniref:hypothetical protein n=1 Tax=Runella rosea TaxID=2259595 RepID=UPI0013B374F5|nr:hypothetical protein [Runella rosea]
MIQKITDLLGDVVWIEHVYGRAWSQVTGLGDKPRTLPFAYTGEGEYFGVLENDFVVSQAFIKIEGPEKYPEGDVGRRNARTEANRPLSIIVWANLGALNFMYKSDYPYTENLKADLMEKLRRLSCLKSFDEYTDEPMEVFRGYDVSKVDVRYLKYPYAAMKLTLPPNITLHAQLSHTRFCRCPVLYGCTVFGLQMEGDCQAGRLSQKASLLFLPFVLA